MVLQKKLVAVGDHCGKTAIIQSFILDEQPEIDPCQLNFTHAWDITDIEVDGTTVELLIWNAYSRFKFQQSNAFNPFEEADVFLLFFSIYERETFDNVFKKWIPEVKESCSEKVPMILVGTHCKEWADNPDQRSVSVEEVETAVTKFGLLDYIECPSAVERDTVEKVFTIAVAAAISNAGEVKAANASFHLEDPGFTVVFKAK